MDPSHLSQQAYDRLQEELAERSGVSAGTIKHYLRDRSQTIRQPAWMQELRHKVTKDVPCTHANHAFWAHYNHGPRYIDHGPARHYPHRVAVIDHALASAQLAP